MIYLSSYYDRVIEDNDDISRQGFVTQLVLKSAEGDNIYGNWTIKIYLYIFCIVSVVCLRLSQEFVAE